MVDSFFAVGLPLRGRMRQKNRFLYGLNKQRERENEGGGREGGKKERKEARDERKEEREEGWRANERSQNEKRG